MGGTFIICKRELGAYFATPLAYGLLIIFALVATTQTLRDDFFRQGLATLSPLFAAMPPLLLWFAPAVAMRLWAEERKNNTLELLLTLPLNLWQMVLGKFLAAWVLLTLALALTFPLVLTLKYLGSPDQGILLGGYLAAWLLAGAFLAIGGFFSTLTRHQVLAFAAGVIFCGAFYYAGTPIALQWLTASGGAAIANFAENFSLQTQCEQLQRGVIELSNLTFFAILIFGGLWASVLVLTMRR